MQTMVQVRMDKELKDRASDIYEAIGIDIPTAIRMLFKRSIMVGGLPFETRVETLSRPYRRVDDYLTDGSLDEIVRAKRSKMSPGEFGRAGANFEALRQDAQAKAGEHEWTLEEINAEIAAARKERHARIQEVAK